MTSTTHPHNSCFLSALDSKDPRVSNPEMTHRAIQVDSEGQEEMRGARFIS